MDHLEQRLLGGEFASAVQVGAAPSALTDHAAVGISQPRHRLASTSIDSEYVHS